MPDAPHFAFPLARGPSGHLATVEQDTLEEIEACVVAFAATHTGEVDGMPTFGHPDWAFRQQPIGRAEIEAEVLRCEPRAQVLVEESPDRFDQLLDTITITVNGGG